METRNLDYNPCFWLTVAFITPFIIMIEGLLLANKISEKIIGKELVPFCEKC